MARQEKSEEGFQRVTVDMPKPLYDKLRRVSFDARDSMNKIVVSLVSDGIDTYIDKRNGDTLATAMIVEAFDEHLPGVIPPEKTRRK